MPFTLKLILSRISLTKSMNSNDGLGSPCLTHNCMSIISYVLCLCLTTARSTEYIALIALVILELTFSVINFCHKNILSILSFCSFLSGNQTDNQISESHFGVYNATNNFIQQC